MSFDEEPRAADLAGGWSIPDEEFAARHAEEFSENGSGPSREPPVVASSFGAFRGQDEKPPEALLGKPDDPILPADGILMLYGDGGAGKTTLTIDAVFHMAGARDWLGLEVRRPVRSLMIENEGPRAMFRRVLGQKMDTFDDPEANERLAILEEPWGSFTLGKPRHRADLAAAILDVGAEVVTLGPLATLGTIGGGTPDEISAFQALLVDVRMRVDRPLSFWLVHHENKSGDVSGAWERVPDTLIHVQGAGNGHTRLVFRKARWSSEFHGRSLALNWEDGRTFSVVEERVRDLYAETLEAFNHADEWRTSKEVSTLIKCRPGEAKSVLAELTRRGDLMFEVGPSGRSGRAQCWRLKTATILTLVPDPKPESPGDGFEF